MPLRRADEQRAPVPIGKGRPQHFGPGFGCHGCVLIQYHKIQSLAAQRIVVVSPKDSDGRSPRELNPQVGLPNTDGAQESRELLDSFPSDALGLLIGRSDVPGDAIPGAHRPNELDERHLSLAEPAAGNQNAEAFLAADHGALRSSQSQHDTITGGRLHAALSSSGTIINAGGVAGRPWSGPCPCRR